MKALKRILNKRKTVIALFYICIIVFVSACNTSEKESVTDDVQFYEEGLNVVRLMDEKLHNEKIVSYMLTDNLKDTTYYSKLINADYSEPAGIYTVELPTGMVDLAAIAGISSGFSISDAGEMSEELKESLSYQAAASYITILMSRYSGVEALALSASLNTKYLFVDTSLEGKNMMCIYIYKDAYPIAVTFSVGKDGAVEAEGKFIIIDDFKTESVEDIENSLFGFIKDMGYDISVAEIIKIK
ncbi:MAG: hypothetical protein IJV15_08255 [Lachnospiraceae bacterium]|nr:hypothetical protein [Lachnospiraceae bacterium]